MTHRKIRLCAACQHRLAVARLCDRCHNAHRQAELARTTSPLPAVVPIPAPQPTKETE